MARPRRASHGSGHEDRVEQGYLLLAVASRTQEEGDPSTALESYDRVGQIAERFDDRDLATLARLGGGQALIALGETALGVTRLDEAMVAVTAGEVSPVIVGIVYCSVIEACQQIFDLRRAHEWTAALDRWCESQPELVRYRGQCLLYRAELKQFHGDWQDADDEAQRARDRLGPRATEPAVGRPITCRPSSSACEASSRRPRPLIATGPTGARPEPDLALFRLEQGGRMPRRRPSAAQSSRRRTPCHEPQLLVPSSRSRWQRPSARPASPPTSYPYRARSRPALLAMAERAEGTVQSPRETPERA